MHYFVLGIFTFLAIVGGILVTKMYAEESYNSSVNSYMYTRGGTDVPIGWQTKIGKGI